MQGNVKKWLMPLISTHNSTLQSVKMHNLVLLCQVIGNVASKFDQPLIKEKSQLMFYNLQHKVLQVDTEA